MNMIKKIAIKTKGKASNIALMASMFLLSTVSSIANATGQSGDIVETLIGGSIGKTLSKDGKVWTVLVAASFLVGGFWAAMKHDPKAFIPAFFVMAIISTITGMFLTF
ncbi:TPA: hypothetical protein ACPSKF_000658 [Legionella anisa]|uniref:hypothetical protein n=1 Tax=Legionella TaxID=445 RepID=UPI000962042F|nr:hypothetical protein [Legionella sp. 39-23]OJW06868.1 MAG: hypothetical protein BGO44_14050 [Legionella sp. 39-23]